jgi:hypothetical protein
MNNLGSRRIETGKHLKHVKQKADICRLFDEAEL